MNQAMLGATKNGPGGGRQSSGGALLTAAFLMLLAGCAGEESPVASIPPTTNAKERPSVILVLIDTLRRDHLNLYGYSRPTSPGLSRLARESFVFDHCYAASSWTKPSTVSLLTGLYPARHGAHDQNSPAAPELTFLAEHLTEQGYACWGVSGNPNASPTFGMDQGFERFHFSQNEVAREYPDITELLEPARAWLQEDRERPLFLYLHVMNVHGPYLSPEGYFERFLEPPREDFEFRCDLWMDIMQRRKVHRRAEFAEGHRNELRARYDAAIAYTDEVLETFFEELRVSGLLDASYLIVTSDHGEELFDHQGFGHGFTLYDEVLRVPLLVRPPGGTQGEQRIDARVGLVDVPSTLLDLLGIPASDQEGAFCDGWSFAPLMGGASREQERMLIGQVHRVKQGKLLSLRQWPYLYVEVEEDYSGRLQTTELYDSSQDPGQQHNLARQRQADAQVLGQTLRELFDKLESEAFQATPVELDDETLRQLEALGYGN